MAAQLHGYTAVWPVWTGCLAAQPMVSARAGCQPGRAGLTAPAGLAMLYGDCNRDTAAKRQAGLCGLAGMAGERRGQTPLPTGSHNIVGTSIRLQSWGQTGQESQECWLEAGQASGMGREPAKWIGNRPSWPGGRPRIGNRPRTGEDWQFIYTCIRQANGPRRARRSPLCFSIRKFSIYHVFWRWLLLFLNISTPNSQLLDSSGLLGLMFALVCVTRCAGFLQFQVCI